jgi:hypothetical protein
MGVNMVQAIEQTPRQRHTAQVVQSLRATLDDIGPTKTEQEVDRLIDELEEAELIARLARSAAWRA